MGSHTGIGVLVPKCLSGAGRDCIFILFKVDAYQTLQTETILFLRAALVTFIRVTDYFFTLSFIFFCSPDFSFHCSSCSGSEPYGSDF